MTEDQCFEIIEMIAAVYTKFDLTDRLGKKRIKIWAEHLSPMPFDRVLHRLNNHIEANKYPPTIADVAVEVPEENHFLDQSKQWETQVKAQKEKGNFKTVEDLLSAELKEKYKRVWQVDKNGDI